MIDANDRLLDALIIPHIIEELGFRYGSLDKADVLDTDLFFNSDISFSYSPTTRYLNISQGYENSGPMYSSYTFKSVFLFTKWILEEDKIKEGIQLFLDSILI